MAMECEESIEEVIACITRSPELIGHFQYAYYLASRGTPFSYQREYYTQIADLLAKQPRV